MSLIASHESTAEEQPTIEDVSSPKYKPEAQGNHMNEDVDTTEDENPQRLELAFVRMYAEWWPGEEAHFDPTEERQALESALWDYLTKTKVIFEAGRLQEAEKRCLKLLDENFTPGYCRANAFRLAARCNQDHGLALEYLKKAEEECDPEIFASLRKDPEDMTVWVGYERLRLIRRSIAERKEQQIAEK